MLTATAAHGDSEIVIAIRYLQAKGTSHSHLYLYREDGKLLRQLTNDNSGQDSDPIFSGDGGTIVFTREKDQREQGVQQKSCAESASQQRVNDHEHADLCRALHWRSLTSAGPDPRIIASLTASISNDS